MKSIGIQFPFTETYDGGIIGYTSIDSEAIKANLIAFLTLKRGQRPMHNSLYSPLYDYIMEPWDEISESKLKSELTQKLSDFFPEIEVDSINLELEEENHLLHMTLYYTIFDLKTSDIITISVVIQS
jgi:phage baseplate assembly protein W